MSLSINMSLKNPQRGHDDESDWVSCSESSHHSIIISSDGENMEKGATPISTPKRKSWLPSFSLRRGRHNISPARDSDAGDVDDDNLSTPKSRGYAWLSRHWTGGGEPPKSSARALEPSCQASETPLVPGLNRLFQSLTRRSQLPTSAGTHSNSTASQVVHPFPPRSARGHHTSVGPSSTPGLPLPHNNVGGIDKEEEVAEQTRLHPLSATILNPSPSTVRTTSRISSMDFDNPSRSPNLADLLTGLSSSEDATRKMAAFKLQSLTNDPSFAEHFVLSGGIPRLRALILETSGNTLAYSLASFARLLEVDQGWEGVNNKVVEKARIPGILHTDPSCSRY